MQKCAQTAVYIQRETSQKRFDVTFLFKGDVLSDLFVDVDVFSDFAMPYILRKNQSCAVLDRIGADVCHCSRQPIDITHRSIRENET